MIDARTILEVTRKLIGATEPYGDSGIDRERTENVDKLIYIIDGLLYDLKKVAVNKDRYEGSMREMGKKAHKAMEDLWSWINAYLAEHLHDAVKVIEELPPAQQWIPCSERLPEDKQRVLVQMSNGYIDLITFSAMGLTGHLVAWSPLPEPWKGGDL